MRVGVVATMSGQTRAHNDGGDVFAPSQSRLGVDRLATPLGIDESLAFRAFDKTIIFGHWLSKNMGIGISLWGFPFEKGFYYILADYFQKSKKIFFQKILFRKGGYEVFSWGFTVFLTCFIAFLTCFIAFLHM